uniref:Uncharacterized protein n=1 Tax=Anguilla anguilla TaxID=7936 RepID=A0A0E9UE53_ANGAN
MSSTWALIGQCCENFPDELQQILFVQIQ